MWNEALDGTAAAALVSGAIAGEDSLVASAELMEIVGECAWAEVREGCGCEVAIWYNGYRPNGCLDSNIYGKDKFHSLGAGTAPAEAVQETHWLPAMVAMLSGLAVQAAARATRAPERSEADDACLAWLRSPLLAKV